MISVSIIIPCYNVEAYIAHSLESALQQSYRNIEIICVDNNSNDSTLKILKDFEKKYPHRITVLQEFRKGACYARNCGLAVAKGSWLQFLDADDLLLENKIEHQVKLIDKNLHYSFVAASFIKKNVDGIEKKIQVDCNDPFKALFISKLGITSSNLFNAEAIKIVGGWNPDLKSSQEADLMFRMLQYNSHVIYDESFLTIIQERSHGQISQLDPLKNWKRFLELRVMILQYLKQGDSSYFEKEKDYYYQNLFILLRIIFKHDKTVAIKVYRDEFEKGFIPLIGSRKNSYSIFFSILGFEKTELLWSVLRK